MIINSNLSKITTELTIHNEVTTDKANTNQNSTKSETAINNDPEGNRNTTSDTRKCVLESSF